MKIKPGIKYGTCPLCHSVQHRNKQTKKNLMRFGILNNPVSAKVTLKSQRYDAGNYLLRMEMRK